VLKLDREMILSSMLSVLSHVGIPTGQGPGNREPDSECDGVTTHVGDETGPSAMWDNYGE